MARSEGRDWSAPLPLEEVTRRLRQALDDGAIPWEGKVLRDFAVLRVPESEQHYWSPELTLQLHADDGGATLMRGLFGPRPAV